MTQIKQNKIFNPKDIIAYFLVAGTGALIQLVSSSLIQDWFNISWSDSIVPSYIIGFFWGFTLTKLFAFDARRSNQTRREMVKFLMVSGVSLFITWAFTIGSSKFLIDYLGMDVYKVKFSFAKKEVNVTEMVCYVIGMGFSFVSNYILHKTFTFKSTGFYNRLKVLIR